MIKWYNFFKYNREMQCCIKALHVGEHPTKSGERSPSHEGRGCADVHFNNKEKINVY